MDTQGIRIRLKSFHSDVVDLSAREIVQAARVAGGFVKGPVPLPMRVKRWTVLRGPHIDKKSREQFEQRTYKRVVDIVDCTPETVSALMDLKLSSSGVSVEIKVS